MPEARTVMVPPDHRPFVVDIEALALSTAAFTLLVTDTLPVTVRYLLGPGCTLRALNARLCSRPRI